MIKNTDHSPEKPWVTGKHPDHTVYRLVVSICEDEHGRVWSEHDFASEEDAAICQATRNAGVEQTAHALLTEALRREAFVDALIILTRSHGILPPGTQEEIVAAVTKVVTGKLPKALPSLVRGILDMISRGAQQMSDGV